MREKWLYIGAAAFVLFALFIGFVPQWRSPGPGRDLGPAGQQMVQFAPTEAEAKAQNRPAPSLPPVADDPRPANAAYKNVKVLTDLSAGDFMRMQYAMTVWVSPKSGPDQGCGFCHAGSDYASDVNPHKAAARIMLAMTRHINADWKSHVGASGVTCFSCHQGQPIPEQVWFQSPARPKTRISEAGDDWNEAARTVRNFFPNEGYEEYLLQATPAHGEPLTALPTGTAPTFVEVKRLYEAMMQMSDGMGVNCGYCHHSRDFTDWGQSTPMRWTGYSGIVMTRDLNRKYLLAIPPEDRITRWQSGNPRPLSLPSRLRGAQIGNGLVDCATCHRGAPKPSQPASPPGGFPGLTAPPPPAPTTVASAAPLPPR